MQRGLYSIRPLGTPLNYLLSVPRLVAPTEKSVRTICVVCKGAGSFSQYPLLEPQVNHDDIRRQVGFVTGLIPINATHYVAVHNSCMDEYFLMPVIYEYDVSPKKSS